MSETDKAPPSEDLEARALRESLEVRALSPQALARIRRATEAEWREHVVLPVRQRWVAPALAASVAALAISLAWIFLVRGAATPGDLFARLESSQAPGVIERLPLWRGKALPAGAEIRAGQELEASGAALLTFSDHGARGGNLRVAAGTALEVVASDLVRLERGEMYVDIPPDARPRVRFAVVTGAGEFRHVGTQFALSVHEGTTRLRVREGSVQWQAADGESFVEAGTEVVIDSNHGVTRRALDTAGTHWSWAESIAPTMDIEGRPLAEFLEWIARETGRKLVIADEAARTQVAAIRMHGDVHGLDPMQALNAVMSSTTLRFDLPAGVIRVSFAGEPPAPPR
jgi:ferric-dicitrate binding protein FerR (iron transport regulator)